MTHAVVGVFQSDADAEHALADLLEKGFPREKISLISPKSEHSEHIKIDGAEVEHGEDIAIGAVGGSLVGGMLGALVGMLIVGIPGIGPVLVAGPIAAAIAGAGAGAVGGGVLGGLTWAGITHDEAHVYENLLHEGKTILMVQTSADKRDEAVAILHRDGAADAVDLEDEWHHEKLI